MDSLDLILNQPTNFIPAQTESICRRQNKRYLKTKIHFGIDQTLREKEKMLVTNIFPFHAMFSKVFFLMVFKILGCVEKG